MRLPTLHEQKDTWKQYVFTAVSYNMLKRTDDLSDLQGSEGATHE